MLRDRLLFSSLQDKADQPEEQQTQNSELHLLSNDRALVSRAALRRCAACDIEILEPTIAGELHLHIEARGKGCAHAGAFSWLGKAKAN